jgi:pimeloyl-ACP methyl ester carboxylesterase
MAHAAAFVRRLTRRLGLHQVDVLGYSWGGLLAQQLAAQHSGAVRKLVLACTGPGVLAVPAGLRITSRLLTPGVTTHRATWRRSRRTHSAADSGMTRR